MNRLRRSPLYSSIFALTLTALALLACVLFQRLLESNLSLPFVAAVWLSAWYQGRSGGLIATAASMVAVLYLSFLPARVEVLPPSPGNLLIRLLSFVLVSLLMTLVTAAWRDNRLLLSSTLTSIGEAVLVTDRDGRVTFLNPVAETLTGWPGAQARGKAVDEVMRLIGEKTREPVENPLFQALRERITVSSAGYTLLVSRSGAEVSIEHSAAPVRDDSGAVRGGILVFRDIGFRRQLEEQITQSQKMEAVGRLAGGMAGDFNNALTVITGYAELLRGEIPPSSPLRRFVEEVILASDRAAAFTRHLLAFSRGTAAQPRVIDLASVVHAMAPMLHRLLGQDIQLILLSSPGLGRVRADAAQIEQVIVNLATNARDAMPNGGKLVIETSNADLNDPALSQNLGVTAGSYVMMAVSDNGIGMDAGTRSRLFEPFFTTKGPGKGSGLGLATVYGAIRQAGGQVTVYSQPGCGTIFEVYLPRVAEVAAEKPKAENRGSETILLVDDEEGVRQVVCAILRSNGYNVLEAGNAAAALAAWEKNAHKVDLVLTDVVMPQMTGFELARQLSERAPGSKILYMSGYRDHVVDGAPAEPPKAFLQKPFAPDTLLAKVREVLDQ
jgi:two-component system, cell cycle sensor histidine kinase and response regulator CckA